MRNLIKPILMISLIFSASLSVIGCNNENDIETQTKYDDSSFKGNSEVPQKGRVD